MLVLSICKVKKFIYLTFLFLGISMFLPTMAFASRTDNHVAKYTVFGQGPLVKVGSVPAVSKSLYKTGVINSGEEMSVNIFLKPRNVSTMNSLLASVYNPSSPDYHHFLKKGQFAAEFGPTKSTYNTVINYLKSVGISDISSGSGDFSVSIKAKSGQLSKVFDTSFMGYKLSDGRKVYANTKAPLLPQTIANATLGVAGFNDMAVMVSNALKGEPISHLVSGKNSFKRSASHFGRHQISVQGNIKSQAVFANSSSGATGLTTTNGVPINSCETNVQSGLFASGYATWTYPQLADYYGFSSLYTEDGEGSGVNIGLVELQNDSENQIQTAWQCFSGSSTPAPVSYVGVNGGQGLGSSGTSSSGAGGEATLDIEVALALAPKSHIIVYQGNSGNSGNSGASTNEYYSVLSNIVRSDNVKVISDSYGICELDANLADAGFMQSESLLLQQAALQDQTFLAASGDTGSSDCEGADPSDNRLSVNDPASQPYATGVGGSSLGCASYSSSGILTKNSGFLLNSGTGCMNPLSSSGIFPVQTAWNDTQEFGSSGINAVLSLLGGASGGGVSSAQTMPNYQYNERTTIPGIIESGYSSSAICGNNSGTYCREVPDVAANADPFFGYPVYYNNSWTAFGGTSAAAPLWAAYIADTDSLQACNNHPVGFLNPVLYQLAGEAPGRYLSPVVKENSMWGGIVTSNTYNSGIDVGYYPVLNQSYDMVTGLGTPTGELANALCSFAASTQLPTTTTTTTQPVTTTQPGTATTIIQTTTTTVASTTTTQPTALVAPVPLIGHLLFRGHTLKLLGRKTSVKLSCVEGNCSGSIKLLMRKAVVVHKGKKAFKKIKFIVVGQKGFRLAKDKTINLSLYIKPYFARMVTPRKKLKLIGEVFATKQKITRINFVLVHEIFKKKHTKKNAKKIKQKKYTRKNKLLLSRNSRRIIMWNPWV